MNIPHAAIEAAAKALVGKRDGPLSDRRLAACAIHAAMPAIRESIAQDIEADLRRNADHMTPNERHGQRRSTRIVRGGAA